MVLGGYIFVSQATWIVEIGNFFFIQNSWFDSNVNYHIKSINLQKTYLRLSIILETFVQSIRTRFIGLPIFQQQKSGKWKSNYFTQNSSHLPSIALCVSKIMMLSVSIKSNEWITTKRWMNVLTVKITINEWKATILEWQFIAIVWKFTEIFSRSIFSLIEGLIEPYQRCIIQSYQEISMLVCSDKRILGFHWIMKRCEFTKPNLVCGLITKSHGHIDIIEIKWISLQMCMRAANQCNKIG